MEKENVVQVLILHDGNHDPCYVTKHEAYVGNMEMIKKLREPHCRFYDFKFIFYDDLETWEDDRAWYKVNTAFVPNPFDPEYNAFIEAFDYLWERGMAAWH